MLSIRIESAATRSAARNGMVALGGTAASTAAAMATTAAPLSAYGAPHKLLPMTDARGDVQGSQCAWSPPD